jgi:hypothetical protein
LPAGIAATPRVPAGHWPSSPASAPGQIAVPGR